jgi:hypothetical protein
MTANTAIEAARIILRERIRQLPPGGEVAPHPPPPAAARRGRRELRRHGHPRPRCRAVRVDRGKPRRLSLPGWTTSSASPRTRGSSRGCLRTTQAPVDIKIEYTDANAAPSRRSAEERMVLPGARSRPAGLRRPRPLFEDVPSFAGVHAALAARSTLGGFHLWSGYWYRRSNMYRRWRARRRQRRHRARGVMLGRVAVLWRRSAPATPPSAYPPTA